MQMNKRQQRRCCRWGIGEASLMSGSVSRGKLADLLQFIGFQQTGIIKVRTEHRAQSKTTSSELVESTAQRGRVQHSCLVILVVTLWK